MDPEIYKLRREKKDLERELCEANLMIKSLLSKVQHEIEVPNFWGLTRMEHRIMTLLLHRYIVDRETIWDMLYGLRADGEMPADKVVDVHVCKLRKKLRRSGIFIEHTYSKGWFLSPESKAKISAMVKREYELQGLAVAS